MKANNILETIGNTPHVRINRLFPAPAEVWMKLERVNPGRSIKDRIGLATINSKIAKISTGNRVLIFCYDSGEYYLSVDGLFQ